MSKPLIDPWTQWGIPFASPSKRSASVLVMDEAETAVAAKLRADPKAEFCLCSARRLQSSAGGVAQLFDSLLFTEKFNSFPFLPSAPVAGP